MFYVHFFCVKYTFFEIIFITTKEVGMDCKNSLSISEENNIFMIMFLL